MTARTGSHAGSDRPLAWTAVPLVPLAITVLALACGDQSRLRDHDRPAADADTASVAAGARTTTLQAGAPTAAGHLRNPYEGDASAIAEGKRLYAWMNCLGCHGELGGGGIGPPLADGDWIYGGSSSVIVQSILQGRPNGMPTYEDQVTPEHAWMIAAYVRTLSDEPPDDGGPQGPADQGAQRGNRR